MNLFHWTKEKIERLSTIEILVILTILIVGTYIALVTPFGAGFDEETHLVRIWQMSALSFIPNEKTGQDLPYPAIYHELSYRRNALIRPVDFGFWESYGNLPLDSHDYVYTELPTRSVYSPFLLLPHSILMRYMGRAWDMPAMVVFYSVRLIGVVCFAALIWLSVRVMPFGKWVFAVTALSPIVLFQAATINTDTLSFGIGFLFIAGCLSIAMKEVFGWREWGVIVFLSALLFSTKLNLTFMGLLPLLILPPKRFQMKNGFIWLIVALLVLWLVEVLGWGLIGFARLETAQAIADPIGQVKFILSHPFHFAKVIVQDIFKHRLDYYLEWVAVYGYNYWDVPGATYYLFPVAVVLSLFAGQNQVDPDKRIRIGLAIVFVTSAIATIAVMYVTYTPVGSSFVDGVQGKYFIPIATLLFLSIVGLPKSKIRIPHWLVAVVTILSLFIYLGGLFLSYHVLCGSSYYSTGLCYQPYYKNWAPNTINSDPISTEFSLTQEIVPECNGISTLRVWANPTGAAQSTFTKFVLRDTDGNHNLVEEHIENDTIASTGWLTFDFPPDWDSRGKTYLFTISNGADSENLGVAFSYSQPGEYKLGKLFENQDSVSNDLVFQYGCISGLEKQIRGTNP
ncbi:MAG: DUF2142 domain-containing protein [Anaerolineales bacterium]|nr:DUF2142 domain-containing protein [Chloroflexota bacterium]MBL6980828.1 DUF2142 domain-containing protein [Anaerolineales bacterium]